MPCFCDNSKWSSLLLDFYLLFFYAVDWSPLIIAPVRFLLDLEIFFLLHVFLITIVDVRNFILVQVFWYWLQRPCMPIYKIPSKINFRQVWPTDQITKNSMRSQTNYNLIEIIIKKGRTLLLLSFPFCWKTNSFSSFSRMAL